MITVVLCCIMFALCHGVNNARPFNTTFGPALEYKETGDDVYGVLMAGGYGGCQTSHAKPFSVNATFSLYMFCPMINDTANVSIDEDEYPTNCMFEGGWQLRVPMIYLLEVELVTSNLSWYLDEYMLIGTKDGNISTMPIYDFMKLSDNGVCGSSKYTHDDCCNALLSEF